MVDVSDKLKVIGDTVIKGYALAKPTKILLKEPK